MSRCLKCFFTTFMMVAFIHGNAQDSIVKYYDADWAEASKERAVYYAEFVKDGGNYKCSSYWVRTNILRGRTVYPDTIMAKPIGQLLRYYKNGNPEDSVVYDLFGKEKDAYHYYENKQLAAHYFVPDGQQEGTVEGFDENGKKIKNYIYAREAEFKGGEKAWHSYIVKKVSKDFFNTKGDAEISVSVSVQFVVDENGYVIRPKVLKSSGINNIDRDALGVIGASPPWKNAVLYNKPVKAYRVQPFTYILIPLKK